LHLLVLLRLKRHRRRIWHEERRLLLLLLMVVLLLLLLLLCRCFAVGCERRRRVLVALAGLHGSNPKRREKNGDEFEKKNPPLLCFKFRVSEVVCSSLENFLCRGAPNTTTRKNASEEEEEEEKKMVR